MTATANQTLGTNLRYTLADMFARRKLGSTVFAGGGHQVEALLCDHPLLAKFEPMQNMDYNISDSECELMLEAPLLLSNEFAFETRFRFTLDENFIRLSVYTNFIRFLDKAGEGSQRWNSDVEGEEYSFDLNEDDDIDAELHKALKAQVQFQIDTLTAAAGSLFGRLGSSDMDTLRVLVHKIVLPEALVDEEL